RFEHGVKRRRAVIEPIMGTAEREHHVGGIRFAQRNIERWFEGDDLEDVPEDCRIGLDLLLELRRSRLDQVTVFGQVWRQDFGIPATAGRQLNYRHVRLNSKELQRTD